MLLGLRGLPFSVPQLLTQVLAWPPRGRVGLTSHLSVPSSLLLFSVCILPSLMHLCASSRLSVSAGSDPGLSLCAGLPLWSALWCGQ